MGSAGCGWRFFGLACLDFSILWKKASREKSEGSLLSFLLLFVSWRSARSLIVPGVFLSTSAGGVAWNRGVGVRAWIAGITCRF